MLNYLKNFTGSIIHRPCSAVIDLVGMLFEMIVCICFITRNRNDIQFFTFIHRNSSKSFSRLGLIYVRLEYVQCILDYLIVVSWTWIMFDNYNFVVESALSISSSYWHVEQVFWMFIIERSQIKHTHTHTHPHKTHTRIQKNPIFYFWQTYEQL